MPNFLPQMGRSGPDWGDADLSILDHGRSPVPAVPLELVPEPWRRWIVDTAAATGAPQDYVFQTALAGLSGVCGAGVRIRVTPAWTEPLVLWQAVVGEPSSGKSSALAPMRRLLGIIEQERRLDDDRRQAPAGEADTGGLAPSQIVVDDIDLPAVAAVVAGNPRGVSLWRDSPTVWLAGAGDESGDWLETWTAGAVSMAGKRRRDLESFPVSILETMWPDRLKAALLEDTTGLSSRFLYVWPGLQPHRSLAAREPVVDDEVLARLRRLSHLARTPGDPCELSFDQRGVAALDGVLADLHAARLAEEGLAAAWLGKGRAVIARLAGACELLGFAGGPGGRPGAIGSEHVEAAAALWRNYFWPHAGAVFDCATLSDHQQRVLRVARWLRDTKPKTASRDEIRRGALAQAATSDETERVLQRLHYLGYVQPDVAFRGRGRRTSHWLVNPGLFELENG